MNTSLRGDIYIYIYIYIFLCVYYFTLFKINFGRRWSSVGRIFTIQDKKSILNI